MIGQILSLLKNYTSGLKRKTLYAAYRDDHVFCLTEMKEQNHSPRKHNIYKGTVVRTEPDFEAAFIDIGAPHEGLLPLRKIALCYYPTHVAYHGCPGISDIARIGQEVLVQVEAQERGDFNTSLTTFITLDGQFLALKLNAPGGIEAAHHLRSDVAEALLALISTQPSPEAIGVLVKSAAAEQSAEVLTAEFQSLLNLWDSVKAM